MNIVMGDVVYESSTHLSDAAVHNYLDVVLCGLSEHFRVQGQIDATCWQADRIFFKKWIDTTIDGVMGPAARLWSGVWLRETDIG